MGDRKAIPCSGLLIGDKERYLLLKVSNYAEARRCELAPQQRLEAKIWRDCLSDPLRRRYVGRSGVEHKSTWRAEVKAPQMDLVPAAECRNHGLKECLFARGPLVYMFCANGLRFLRIRRILRSRFQ
jgi:hypothetical protein